MRALTNCLADSEPSVRREAVNTLNYFAIYHASPEDALPALFRSLNDLACDQVAVQAIGNYGTQAATAVPVLTKLLKDDDRGLRKNAAEALGKIGIGAHESVDALLEALPSGGRAQPAIACALGQIRVKPEKVIPALVKLFESHNAPLAVTSSACALAVGQYGADAIPYLLPLLESQVAHERYWSAGALCNMKSPTRGALPALEKSSTTRMKRSVRW